MKVIVSITDAALMEPLVFKDVETVEKLWKQEGWDRDDPDFPLMIAALRRGENFAGDGDWIGWVEVAGSAP